MPCRCVKFCDEKEKKCERMKKVEKWESKQAKRESYCSFACSPSVRPSFREAFRLAAMQVGLAECRASDRGLITELCYVMAEVYAIRDDGAISICGEMMDAGLVKGVFELLRLPHLEMVADNIAREKRVIKNKRAYMRTALYNAVFEYEAQAANLYAMSKDD